MAKPASDDKAKFLKRARDRFKRGSDADKSQRNRELEALKFYAGQQWDKDLLKSREGQAIGSGSNQQVVPARPSLVINKTREPVRSILNQERQSEMAIEIVPADDWGNMTGPIDHTEIELREGLVRRIQRESEAADARTWAFSRATIAGRGYYLVMTRYAPGKTTDQEIYVHKIYNQNSVVVDPAHEQSDGSDADWFFIGTDIPFEQYKAEFGMRNGKENRLADDIDDAEWRALGDEAPDWFVTQADGETRFVRVVDYYYTERKSRALAMFPDGRAEWVNELPEGATGYETRHVVEKTIKWCKIDGCNDDVLEETEWPGHYLPLVKVVGEELQPYDNERRCEGIVEPMMDSCRGFNYVTSKFVERVGLTPIPPIMMAGGQDEGYENEWDSANTRTLSRLHYNQRDGFGQPAPPPFKPDARAEIGDLAMGVQMFSDAIVSTSRVPETALGHVDPSVKSGKLANALIAQAETSNSNYIDNLKRSMRHEARIINDLLYPIYGTRPGRLARMMDPSGKASLTVIGQPFVMQGAGQQARPQVVPEGAPDAKTMQLTPDCDFNVAVRITRASDTRRQEITGMLTEIVSASPEQMAIIGDLIWKFADAPEHEELEKRYKAMLAPAVQAVVKGQPNIPPEVQQQMAQLQAQNQELMQLADKNKTDLAKAQMQERAEDARNRENNETKLAVAELGAKMDRLALFLEERARLGVQQHELNMAQVGHQQALQQAEQEQENALQQGMQQHAQSQQMADQQAGLAAQAAEQQAALQPPPQGA